MARIRTVKPELFKHEDLFDAEVESGLPLRLAFIGLFTCCDREGRFKWRPRALKLDIMPYDHIEFDVVLDKLTAAGFVQKYEVDGELYGCIPTFLKHQAVNQREAKSSIPGPDDEGAVCLPAAHVHAHATQSRGGEYQYNGVNIAPALRDTILARDGHRCARCNATDDLTIDHIFPRSIGGTHAPTNLRVLCRPCNSARPVAGQALIDDLAKDGLTLDDMQRMCMHVQAHGEGKGKERKGKELSCDGVLDAPASPATALVPSEPKPPSRPKEPAPTSKIWESYRQAYANRYGVDPVRNAKVNGQLSQLLQRLGEDDAVAVAAWYIDHNDRWYVSRLHAVDCLLRDCEKLRTEWATGRRMTQRQAHEADRRQATVGMVDSLTERLRAQGKLA